MKYALIVVALSACLNMAGQCAAQETHSVHFAAGTTGATIHGAVKGDSYVDYHLSVSGGQSMSVILKPESIYFNVMAPNSNGEALFIGSASGPEYNGTIPTSGTYTIRIY